VTTLPAIDVDFAIPSATIEAGMPAVDVAIPGLTGPAGSQKREVVFGTKGPIATIAVGTIPYPLPFNGVITKVIAACSAQTSGSTLSDVNINDVSIYTDQSQRPNLAGTGRQSDEGGTIGAGSFTAGQFLTVDRDSFGVGLKDWIVTVEYEPT